MFDKGKKIISLRTILPQVILLFSQFLFLTVVVGGFSLLSRASFTTYERSLSPLCVDGGVSSFYDWTYKLQIKLKTFFTRGEIKLWAELSGEVNWMSYPYRFIKSTDLPLMTVKSWGTEFTKYPLTRLEKYAQQITKESCSHSVSWP